jgi:hypothetical protein
MSKRGFVGLFLLCRLVLLISLPLDGLRGYGDQIHFYRLASMGIPFIDFWLEYPPIFPFLAKLLLALAGGRQHTFEMLLALILTLAQAGSLWLFVHLAERTRSKEVAMQCAWIYFAITLCLPYGWWYIDALGVFATLLGLWWLSGGKDTRAGIALALGTLTKLFPVLVVPIVWRWLSWRRASIVTSLALGLTVVVYAALYLASPQLTAASLRSQMAKGTWETIWALIDGNLTTGNFGPESERYDASTALLQRGNPAKIPSWLTLIPFAAFGGWLLWRSRLDTPRAAIAFLGVTWSLFLLWSPGYSPQWVLYQLPIILLVLPLRRAYLLSAILTLLNIIEWPVMLSRGYNWGLWMTVPLRAVVWILLAVEFWWVVNNAGQLPERTEADWLTPDPTLPS